MENPIKMDDLGGFSPLFLETRVFSEGVLIGLEGYSVSSGFSRHFAEIYNSRAVNQKHQCEGTKNPL